MHGEEAQMHGEEAQMYGEKAQMYMYPCFLLYTCSTLMTLDL